MPVHEQVKQFIETQHINKNKLARQLGSNATNISNIVRGKSNPSTDWLSKFVELYPSINCFWLLTGKGEMIDHDSPISIFNEIKELEIRLSACNDLCGMLKDQLTDKEKLIQLLEKRLDDEKN